MKFKGLKYVLNQCSYIFDFMSSNVGEYTVYYDKIIFHTKEGFIAAYADNLENNWEI